MQNLLAQVQALQLSNTPNHGSNYGRGPGHRCGCGGGRGDGRGRGRARPLAPPIPKYLLTHLNCRHGSKEFTYPDNGQKKEASFAHMMSGNTYWYYNIAK